MVHGEPITIFWPVALLTRVDWSPLACWTVRRRDKNKAGYTATPVACGWEGVVFIIWAGAVRPKTAKTPKK